MNDSHIREIVKNNLEIRKIYTIKAIDEMKFPELGKLINLYNDLKNK